MKPNELINDLAVDKSSSGIYMILCVPTNIAYIGRASIIKKRWQEHCRGLKKKNHYNVHLQNSWDKYGNDKFIFIALENCPIDKLYERESYYTSQIDEDLRFNQAPIIDKVPASEEYRKNLSESKKNQSEETRKKIGDSHRGMKHTEESKLKMSNSLKGKVPWNKGKIFGPLSEETKLKLSVSLSGEKNPFYGKTHSVEALKKISKSSRERRDSPETKKRKSEAQLRRQQRTRNEKKEEKEK